MNQRDPEATTAGDCVPEPPHAALEDQTCCFVQDDPAVITAPHLQAREPGHRAWVPPEDTGWPAASGSHSGTGQGLTTSLATASLQLGPLCWGLWPGFLDRRQAP